MVQREMMESCIFLNLILNVTAVFISQVFLRYANASHISGDLGPDFKKIAACQDRRQEYGLW